MRWTRRWSSASAPTSPSCAAWPAHDDVVAGRPGHGADRTAGPEPHRAATARRGIRRYALLRLSEMSPEGPIVDPWDVPSGWRPGRARPVAFTLADDAGEPLVVTISGTPEQRVRRGRAERAGLRASAAAPRRCADAAWRGPADASGPSPRRPRPPTGSASTGRPGPFEKPSRPGGHGSAGATDGRPQPHARNRDAGSRGPRCARARRPGAGRRIGDEDGARARGLRTTAPSISWCERAIWSPPTRWSHELSSRRRELSSRRRELSSRRRELSSRRRDDPLPAEEAYYEA